MCSDETGLLHMLLISFLYLVTLLQNFLSYEQLRAASLIGRNAGTCRPAKSHASRVRLTHFRGVLRSHSAQWKSHAFSCSTKNNIFNVTSVLFFVVRNESSHSGVTFVDTWLANIHVRLHQTHGTVTVSRLATRP